MSTNHSITLTECVLGLFILCVLAILAMSLLGPVVQSITATYAAELTTTSADLTLTEVGTELAAMDIDFVDPDISEAQRASITAFQLLAFETEVVASNHGKKKHGPDYEAVHDYCRENNNVMMILYEVATGNYHRICVLPDGRIGDQIVHLSKRLLRWSEVTAFVCENQSSLADVITRYNGVNREMIQVFIRQMHQ